MLLKLLSLIMLSAYAYGPQPADTVKPLPRPSYLQVLDQPEIGEVRDNKVTLRITFPTDGLYYQRDNRTHNIPIMYYFKNEYPEIDFSGLQINRLTINSRAYSNNSHIGFHNYRGRRFKKAEIPMVAFPGEALGEYSQTIIEQRNLRRGFNYISIKGVVGINNITLELTRGTPNFTFDTTNFEVQGKQVSPISGYVRAGFDEARFQQIMVEVKKMSTIPEPVIEEEVINPPLEREEPQNNDDEGQWSDDYYDEYEDEDEYGDDEEGDFHNQTPIFGDDNRRSHQASELSQFPQRTINIGRLKSRGGKIRIERLGGSARLIGFHVVYRDGRTFYQEYDIAIDQNRSVLDFNLSRNYSYSTITLYFQDVSRDGEVFLDWWEL